MKDCAVEKMTGEAHDCYRCGACGRIYAVFWDRTELDANWLWASAPNRATCQEARGPQGAGAAGYKGTNLRQAWEAWVGAVFINGIEGPRDQDWNGRT